MRNSSPRKSLRTFGLLAAGTILWSPASAQFIFSNPAGGNWSSGSNWTAGLIPGSSPLIDVYVNYAPFSISGAVVPFPTTINTTSSVSRMFVGGNVSHTLSTLTLNNPGSVVTGSYLLNGATLTGAGTLQINGLFTLQSGTLSGTGLITADGGIRVIPSPDMSIQRPLVVSGTSSWESGTVYGTNGVAVQNWGSFTISNPTDNAEWTGDQIFVNMPGGVVTKTSAVNTKMSATNNGSWNVNAGIMRFNNTVSAASHAGQFVIGSGASIRFTGTNDFTTGSDFSGAGTAVNDAGTVNFGDGSSVYSGFTGYYGTTTFAAGSTIGNGAKIIGDGGTININSGVTATPSSYSITSSGGTSTVNSDMSLGTFTLSGGTFTGTGNTTASGLVTLSNGTLSGAGTFLANGGVKINPTTGLTIGKSIDASSNSSWESSNIVGAGGALFRNSGVFSITNSLDGADWSGTSVFQNTALGTVNKSSTGSTRMSATNHGVWNVTNGIMRINNSAAAASHAGDFTVGSAGQLRFTGTNDFTSGSSLAGAGTTFNDAGALNFRTGSLVNGKLNSIWGSMTFDSGSSIGTSAQLTSDGATVLVNSGATVSGSNYTVTANGGTSTFNTNSQFGTVTLQGGTLTGSGNFTVTGQFQFAGGSLTGTGTLTAAGGVVISGTGTRYIQRPMIAQGSSTWGTTNVNAYQGSFAQNGTMTFNGTGDWAECNFTNNGSLVKQGPGTTSTLRGGSGFRNLGIVNIFEGTLFVQTVPATGHTGTFNVSSGATFQTQNNPNFQSGSKLQGAGLWKSLFGTVNFNSGSTFGINSVDIASTTLNINPGATVAASPNIVLNSSSILFNSGAAMTVGSIDGTVGNLNAISNMTVTGQMAFDGTVTGAGTWTLDGLLTFKNGQFAPGGAIFANGGIAFNTAGIKDIKRDITAGGSSSWGQGEVFNTNAFINNGTLNITNSETWQGGSLGNTGTIWKQSSSGTTLFSSLTGFTNSGFVRTDSGDIEFDGSGTHSGNFFAADNTNIALRGAEIFTAPSQSYGGGRLKFFTGPVTFQSGTTVSTDLSADTVASLTFGPGSFLDSTSDVQLVTSGMLLDTGQSISLSSVTLEASSLTSNHALAVTGQIIFDGGRIAGAGPFDFLGGINFISANLKQFGSSFNLGGNSNWADGIIEADAAAIVNSTGTFTVTGGIRWYGGVFKNLGTFNKAGGNTITRVAMPSDNGSGGFFGAQFSNSGQVNVQTGTLIVGGYGGHSGDFLVSNGATLSFDSPQVFQSGSATTSNGTTRFESGISDFESGSSITGNLVVQGGTVNFLSGSNPALPLDFVHAGSGTINFATGSTRNFNNLTLSNGLLTGPDTIQVANAFNFNAGTLSGSGPLNVTGGVVFSGTGTKTFSRQISAAGTSLVSNGLVMATGGTFTNSGTLRFDSDTDWYLGTIQNSGTIEKTAGSAFTDLYPNSITNTGLIKSAFGTLRVNGLAGYTAGTNELNSGSFRSENGGTLSFTGITSAMKINRSNLELSGSTSKLLDASGGNLIRSMNTNYGQLKVLDGAIASTTSNLSNSGLIQVGAGSSYTLNGILTMLSGQLQVDGSLAANSFNVTGGAITGNGALTGSITNNGELSPGNPIGFLNVSGNYTQTNSGTFRVEIQAPTTNACDTINVSGTANLNGTLAVDIPIGMTIPNGTRYSIMNSNGGVSGIFINVPPANEWSVEYFPNKVDIVKITNSAPLVPVSGQIVLSGWTNLLNLPLVRLRLMQGSTVAQVTSVTPGPNSTWTYSFQTPQRGTYTLEAFTERFLVQKRSITIGASGATASFNLVPGDVDLDNEIGSSDFDAIVAGFGTTINEGSYIPNTDLDGDGEVGSSDFDLVVQNFGMSGD